MRELIERVAAVLTWAILTLVAGYFWFALSFADLAPGETLLERLALIMGFEVLGAVVIGILLVRFWYFSVTAALAPTLGVISWGMRPSAAEFLNIALAASLGPVLALASGYLGAFVRRGLWEDEYSSSVQHAQPLHRSLALAVGALLVGWPAWLLYETIGFPPPARRTENDFVFFAIQLFIIYGGVALGVLVYQAGKKHVGQPLRPLGIIEAGVLGVLVLSAIFAVSNISIMGPLHTLCRKQRAIGLGRRMQSCGSSSACPWQLVQHCCSPRRLRYTRTATRGSIKALAVRNRGVAHHAPAGFCHRAHRHRGCLCHF
jgi:hypothetical protein